ncbi:10615_t:CDS:1, partial [Entrophospora sp. SA101]
MLPNNSQMENGICNETIGIITGVDVDNEQVRIAFPVNCTVV